MLDDLPHNLQVDIQKARYAAPLKSSLFFQDKKDSYNENVMSYFFKVCSYMVVVSGDVILNIGEETDKIYLLLHGGIEGVNFETKKYIRLMPGDYFGALIPMVKIGLQYKAWYK